MQGYRTTEIYTTSHEDDFYLFDALPLRFNDFGIEQKTSIAPEFARAQAGFQPFAIDGISQHAEFVTGRSDFWNKSDNASEEKAWREFDDLMARLAESHEVINILDDEMVDRLRESADDRLKWLYDSES